MQGILLLQHIFIASEAGARIIFSLADAQCILKYFQRDTHSFQKKTCTSTH
jgi:hypothetical protein